MQCHKTQLTPEPKRPIMIIRLRIGHEEPEIWRRTFRQLVENREACDEVWFSTGVGVITLEEHRRLSSLMASHAEELRQAGIIPSLQIQATLGHSDNSTEVAGVAGKTWGSYVGRQGEQCRFINCPTQPAYLDYLEEMSRIYAEWHPGSVWIDDDLRPSNHSPASTPYGCYCSHCLALFAEVEGKLYTREELVEKCEEDSGLLTRWMAFVDGALAEIAGRIARPFHEISPETTMGLQHGAGAWRVPIMEKLREVSGHRVASRPGGGAYSDHHPYALIHKAYILSFQKETQQGYDTISQVCSEIESYPRTMCCKTAQGLRIESLLHLAVGMDSLSYFIMDAKLETPEWYGRELIAPLAADAPSYREFLRHNQGCQAEGVGLCSGAGVNLTSQPEELGLPLVGVPFASFSPKASCRMLNGVVVNSWQEKDLKKYLTEDVLLDGDAVSAIIKRGMGELLENVEVRPITDVQTSESYTADPINDGLKVIVPFSFSEHRYAFTVPDGVPLRVLSNYKDIHGDNLGAACIILERENGTRMALLGNDGFNVHTCTSARIRFLYRLVDWVSHGSLPILPMEPIQCLLVPNVTEQRILRSVTALNVTIGYQQPVELMLHGVPAEASVAEWNVPSMAPVLLPLRHSGDDAYITLPQLSPWEIGWLKI
ncbi:MAG: hypothetical protein J6X55_14635 [Victivallales bacterium]|nr:hypothetical protein [Victivallales bacterium]